MLKLNSTAISHPVTMFPIFHKFREIFNGPPPPLIIELFHMHIQVISGNATFQSAAKIREKARAVSKHFVDEPPKGPTDRQGYSRNVINGVRPFST